MYLTLEFRIKTLQFRTPQYNRLFKAYKLKISEFH